MIYKYKKSRRRRIVRPNTTNKNRNKNILLSHQFDKRLDKENIKEFANKYATEINEIKYR